MLINPFPSSGLLSLREAQMKFKLTCEANPGPADHWSQIKNTPPPLYFSADSAVLVSTGGPNCIVANASNNGHGTFGFLSLSRPRLWVKPAEGKGRPAPLLKLGRD